MLEKELKCERETKAAKDQKNKIKYKAMQTKARQKKKKIRNRSNNIRSKNEIRTQNMECVKI